MDVPVKVGDIVDNRYHLERIIGTGGMAVVFSAIDLELSQRVAVKFLFRKAARHKEILQRFEREKSVISSLEGEHIARILGAGVVKNTPYMVMEFLQGRDLANVLEVQKTLPVRVATEYVLQACEAVAEAHGLDIVHRDLKPGNLFLTHRDDASPCIKVLDFGIAKILAMDSADALTRTEVVMGSPHYMSPEQMISSKDVGPTTDIWSLGVILHELVAGKLPFAEATTDELCSRVLNGEPTPLRRDSSGSPAGLEKVILKCLARKPKDRFRDVAELASAIGAFAPPSAKRLIPRIRHRLEHPGTAPPELVDVAQIGKGRDPAEPSEAPTIYLKRNSSSIPWKTILLVGFGVGMAGLGFAGGHFLRKEPPAPGVSDPNSTTSAVPVLPGSTVMDVATASPDPTVHEVPLELDLDDSPARRERQAPQSAAKKKEKRPAPSAEVPEAQEPAVSPTVSAPAPVPVPVVAPESSS